jgi:hypothetical protein
MSRRGINKIQTFSDQFSCKSDDSKHPKSYFLGDLKPHPKFHNPLVTPSGRQVTKAERKKKNVNGGHLVPMPLIEDT